MRPSLWTTDIVPNHDSKITNSMTGKTKLRVICWRALYSGAGHRIRGIILRFPLKGPVHPIMKFSSAAGCLGKSGVCIEILHFFFMFQLFFRHSQEDILCLSVGMDRGKGKVKLMCILFAVGRNEIDVFLLHARFGLGGFEMLRYFIVDHRSRFEAGAANPFFTVIDEEFFMFFLFPGDVFKGVADLFVGHHSGKVHIEIKRLLFFCYRKAKNVFNVRCSHYVLLFRACYSITYSSVSCKGEGSQKKRCRDIGTELTIRLCTLYNKRADMEGFFKFFGTGGARFMALKQLRATGGLWMNYRSTNVYIDPGPGAIVRIRASRDDFEPARLDGIILTHKHMDHANDVNILIETMAEGGFKKRGTLFCPEDAITEDPVVLNFARNYLENVVFLKEGGEYTLGDISFRTPVRHRHPVETYGLLFDLNTTIGLISDTRYFPELGGHYRAENLIINVLRLKPIENHEIVDHLALDDVEELLQDVRPANAILTHFGMHIVKNKPALLAKKLSKATGVNVIAGRDGMKWEF